MTSSINSSRIMRRPRAPTLRDIASREMAAQGVIGEAQLDVLEVEQPLILLHDGVLRLGKNFDQGVFVQIAQHADHWQTADEFGDQAELDQVLRFDPRQQLGIALVAFGEGSFFVCVSAEAHGAFAKPAADDALKSDECATADKEDVGGVDRSEFLVRMLASALRGNIGDGAFQNLEQRLLHAFAGDITGDGRVLVLAADLVDFVDVDDAGLRAGHIAIGSLQKLQDDVLDILADVTGFGQRGGVNDREGNIEHFGQRLGQQAFCRCPSGQSA